MPGNQEFVTMFKAGDVLLQKYRVEKFLGKGTFGEVYCVTHLGLDVLRAVKVLRRDAPGVGSTEYDQFLSRFRLEAQIGAKLNSPTPHPNLLQVHNFETTADQLVLEMEYASGGSLAERIQNSIKSGKAISIENVIKIALGAANGLDALHNRDIVHRDLKPSNILFDEKERVKIADLGLAQVPYGPSIRSQLSMPALHPGTPAYMSPEQETTQGVLKSPSDIYALGLVIFEMLTGRNYIFLRSGTQAASLRADIPAWLDDLLVRMLERSPDKRPWDGNEAAGLLRAGIEQLKTKQEQQQKNEREEQEVKQQAAGIIKLTEAAAQAIKNREWERANEAIEDLEKIGEEAQAARLREQLKQIQLEAHKRFLQEQLAGEITRLTQETEAALARRDWETSTRLINKLDRLGSEGVKAARKLRPGLPTFWQEYGVWITALTALVLVGVIIGGLWWAVSTFFPDGTSQLAAAPLPTQIGLNSSTQVEVPASPAMTPETSNATILLEAPAPWTGVPMPWSSEVISTTNADRVVELARWGQGGINGLAWSPDGGSLAVATSIGLYIYNAETLELRNILRENEWFSSVSYSPDGNFLISGDFRGNLILWDKAGSLIRSVYSGDGYIYALAISPDNSLIAAVHSENKTILIDAGTNSVRYQFDTNTDGKVKFSPDGKLLASGGWDGISLYDTTSGELVNNLIGDNIQTGGILVFDFLPDGKNLITGNTGGELLLWDTERAELLKVLDRYEDNDQFENLAISPNGLTLIVSRTSGKIDIWDLNTQQKQTHQIPLEYANQISYSPQGDFLITSSYNGFLQLWNADNWNKLAEQNGFVQIQDVYKTGDNTLFIDARGSTAFELDLITGQVLSQFTCPGMCIKSPGGNLLGNIDPHGQVSVWEITSNATLFNFDKRVGVFGGSGSMALTPQGNFLAAGGMEGVVYLWDLLSGQLRMEANLGDGCMIRSMEFNNDGKSLAAGTDCGLYLWDVASAAQLYHFGDNTSMVRGISFSPDNNTLAAENGMWDMSSGSLIYSMEQIISDIAFNPQSDLLALSGWPNLALANVNTGEKIAQLMGHTLWTEKIFIDPAGKYIISSSDDNTVRIWGIP